MASEKLVTLTSNGITMTVPAGEVSHYTRAGYVVVEPGPVKVEEPEPEPEPVKPARAPKK
jgi:hypothetical protein